MPAISASGITSGDVAGRAALAAGAALLAAATSRFPPVLAEFDTSLPVEGEAGGGAAPEAADLGRRDLAEAVLDRFEAAVAAAPEAGLTEAARVREAEVPPTVETGGVCEGGMPPLLPATPAPTCVAVGCETEAALLIGGMLDDDADDDAAGTAFAETRRLDEFHPPRLEEEDTGGGVTPREEVSEVAGVGSLLMDLDVDSVAEDAEG